MNPFWLAFEPSSIGVSKRANGPRPSCPSRSFPPFTPMLLKRGKGCFFPRSLTVQTAARSLPSFTAMLLKRGEKCFSSWRLLLAFFFNHLSAFQSEQMGHDVAGLSRSAMLFRCGEGSVLEHVAGLRTLFLGVSKRANGPRSAALRRPDPSRSAMLFRCCDGISFADRQFRELTAPRPAALQRHDLPRSAMLFRCGKMCIFELFGWLLKFVLYL